MLSGQPDVPHYVLIVHPDNWRDALAGEDARVGDRFEALFSGRYLSLAGLLTQN